MKYKFCWIITLVTFLLLPGCKESFFDINNDPNNPETSTPTLVLPSGIAGSAYVLGGYYQNIGGFWSQHYTQATAAGQWVNLEDYSITEDDFDSWQFQVLYSEPLMDLEYIRKSTSQSQNWSYYMIATLMQSYTFQVLADLYDEIPFSEALNGITKLTPKFEKGKDICDSLITRIDYALSRDFTKSTVTHPGNEDIIFQGNLEHWRQFANTLKLQIYLRWVNVDPNKYKSQIEALLTENNFLEVPARMTAFRNEENNRNPLYETFVSRLAGNLSASATLLDTLRNANDPRLNAIFSYPLTPAGGTNHIALQQGTYRAAIATYPTIQNLSTPNLNPLDPVYFFSVPEVDFLIAEAQLRYGTEAKAIEYYKKGIDDSFTHFGLTPDSKFYETGGAYEYKGLASIITQKWIAAANCRAIESFFDFNRTGFPNFFTVTPVSTIGTQRPERLLYPLSERQTNPNTPAFKYVYDKVWWAL
jgi:hypothetical protein